MAYISKFKGAEIDSYLTELKNSIKPKLDALASSTNEAIAELTELSNTTVATSHQAFSEEQKKQARTNIGAASLEDLNRMYNELLSLIQGGVVNPSYAILDQAILDQAILS